MEDSCPICSNLSRTQTKGNQKIGLSLMQILTSEIDRDGGISYLNQLKSHSTSVLISTLLKSHSPPLKLASFLEKYPNVFVVKRGNKDDRHIVSLQCNTLPFCQDCQPILSTRFEESDARLQSAQDQAARSLEERLYYVLTQRYEKMKRRAARNRAVQGKGALHSITKNKLAQVEWLAHQLEKEIYQYVRLLEPNQRPTNALVGRPEWWRKVIPIFIQFLQKNTCNHIRLHNNDTQVEFVSLENNMFETNTSPLSLLSVQTTDNRTNITRKQLIASNLESILSSKNTPKVNGIDYGMLLQKNDKLRQLLHGEDLIQMIHSEQECSKSQLFHNITLFQSENNNWRIGLKEGSTIGQAESNDDSNPHRLDSADNDIGLYSVTGSKIASSMAKCLSRALADLVQKTGEPLNAAEQTTCIDLTAGIGGNTIACAKFFSSVISFEIDEERASICRQNIIKRYGIDTLHNSTITIRCENAIGALSQLAQQFGRMNNSSAFELESIPQCCKWLCFILDPPWGGLNYRNLRDKPDEGIALIGTDGKSNVPLSEVVQLISMNLAPTVLGIKLPLTFDVDFFMERLEKRMTRVNEKFYIEVASIKKMKRQLFIVLRLL